MAYLYRPTQTKPIPEGAEFFTRKGERFARWKDAKGKIRVARVIVSSAGKEKMQIESPFWRVRYRDGNGALCDASTGCRLEDTARNVMNDLNRRAELVKSNVISASEDAAGDHADKPIAAHIDGYIAHLRAKGSAPHRVGQVRARLDRLALECGFGRLSQLCAGALERWLVCRQGEKMSASTRNGYRESIVGFANWCRRTHRLMANPFTDVPLADVKSDRRRERRALTEMELIKLLEVAQRRPLDEALTIRTGKNKGKAIANVRPEMRTQLERVGRERALIYKTLVLTGLRKGELESITVGNVDLDSLTPHLRLNAADEKNRQGSDLPLRPDLASDIRSWLSDRLRAMQDAARMKIGEPIPMKLSPTSTLFNIPSGMIRILDRDLVAAGIARMIENPKTGKMVIDKRDERGRTIDIHALRTTFGTHLSKGGVSLRTAQAAMRHSKPELTANVYTDPKLLDVAGALNALPTLSLNPNPTRNEEKATGTPGRINENEASAIALLIALPTGQSSILGGIEVHEAIKKDGKVSQGETFRNADSVNRKGPKSVQDPEPVLERANGFEPSTFTLGT